MHFWMSTLDILIEDYDISFEEVENLYSQSKQIGYHYLYTMAQVFKNVLRFKKGEREVAVTQMKEVINEISDANYITHTAAMGYLAEMYLEIEDVEQAQTILVEAENVMRNNFEEPQLVYKMRLRTLSAEIARRKKEYENAQNILQDVMNISQQTENLLLQCWVHGVE